MIKVFSKFFFNTFPLLEFKIKEKSMEPTLKDEDTVLINRFTYVFRKPKRKDIIVFKLLPGGKRYIIKRIAKINKDKYFVLGDNKKESIDSRKFGWIARKEIVGKVIGKI